MCNDGQGRPGNAARPRLSTDTCFIYLAVTSKKAGAEVGEGTARGPMARMYRKCLLGLAVLAGMSGACSDPVSGQQRELDANRGLWSDENITEYTYTLQISCFCPPEITQPVVVRVSQDSILSVVSVASGEPVEGSLVGNFYTVEDLFDVVQDAIDGEAHELSVTYDADLHYPTSIVIDYDERAIDEELALTASQLKPGV